MALKLNFACGNYDRMDALKSGEVAPEGIDLEFVGIDAPREIFDRMMGENAFDVSELSSSEFISMTAAGDRRFVAIPVFPSKAFRHGFFCINRNAGIATPKDLEGKRIGVPLYTQTAAVWCRGHLAEDYGVDLSTVEWVQGAVEKVGTHGTPSAPPLLKPANIVQNETGRSLSDMLADGEIDALLGSRLPDSLRTHPDVVRLFPRFPRGREGPLPHAANPPDHAPGGDRAADPRGAPVDRQIALRRLRGIEGAGARTHADLRRPALHAALPGLRPRGDRRDLRRRRSLALRRRAQPGDPGSAGALSAGTRTSSPRRCRSRACSCRWRAEGASLDRGLYR